MEFVDIIIEYLPIFMFLAMGILLFIGYPVGFILGGVAVTFGLIGYGFGVFMLWWSVFPDGRRLSFSSVVCLYHITALSSTYASTASS